MYLDNKIGSKRAVTYHSTINDLLNPLRPRARFVGSVDSEVKEMIENAFAAVTGQQFPDDIIVHICGQKEFAAAHGNWHDGIIGFALNRKDEGLVSDIFVQQDELDSLMLTIGHELGHVMTKRLGSLLDEEAKAFAFSIAWTEAIIRDNIGGLCNNFSVNHMPANNGIHDVAFNFVTRQIAMGKNAMDVFRDIVRGRIMVGG